MRTKSLALLVGMLATFGASAQADRAFEDMDAEAGIRDREARMLMGAASSFAEYRTSYWRARDKLWRAARDDGYVAPRAVRKATRKPVPVAPPAAVEEPVAETFPFEED